MPLRSDYVQIFEKGGAEALNKTLAERFPHKWDHAKELRRMAASGLWATRWDEDVGRTLVLARLPGQAD